MNGRFLSFAVMACVIGAWGAPACAAPGFFVAPDGRDTNAGTRAAPFGTLERARDAVRALPPEQRQAGGGITVWLRGGDYARTNTFELTEGDSGTAQSPVTYRAWRGETVRIHGATPLAPGWFGPVPRTAPAWARLDPAARDHVVQADLRAHGITNFGTLQPRGYGISGVPAALELFFTNAPMPLARWPDPEEGNTLTGPAPTNDAVTLFGSPASGVAGHYVARGRQDGVNAYARVGLVGGRQYHLYRNTWDHDGRTHTAWFLAAQASGYPSDAAPWWYVYTPDFNRLTPATRSGAKEGVSFVDPARIEFGFAHVQAAPADTRFAYAGDRPRRWAQADDVWFHGYWKHLWADDYRRAAHIDVSNRTVSLEGALSFGIEDGRPFHALNLLEEITRPGEWYLDRASGTLYFWPPAGLAGRDIRVSMLETPLVRLTQARWVVLDGLTLEMGRSELVRIEGGEDNAVVNCVLRNAGTTGVRVTGRRNGVAGCDIADTGEVGVALSGGDRVTLTSADLYVRNCDIRRFGRWSWTYKPGVLLQYGSVGHTVAHNRIHDAPHTGILIEWGNDHAIESNEIFNVCSLTADAGAIYCGRDLGARGNVIRGNFVHDVVSPFGEFGSHGIYLDDGISGVEVSGNVLYRISHNGIQAGGGRDNLIVNNVMVKCGTGLAADARGIGWMMANGGTSNMWRNLQSFPYQGPVWSNAYPACAAIPADWVTFSNQCWMTPQGSVFARNIGFRNGRWTTEQDRAFSFYAAITNNLPDVDPRFVDEAHLDLTLRADSPARAIPGFVAIPVRRIGIGGR